MSPRDCRPAECVVWRAARVTAARSQEVSCAVCGFPEVVVAWIG